MKVVYLHGLESGPWGTKSKALAESYEVVAPKLSTELCKAGSGVIPETILDEARAAIEEAGEGAVLVASSFGAAVAVALINKGLWNGPSVLLAPAHKKWGQEGLPRGYRAPTVVIHGTDDTVVPYEDGVDIAQNRSSILLTSKGGDHRLHSVAKSGLLIECVKLAYLAMP